MIAQRQGHQRRRQVPARRLAQHRRAAQVDAQLGCVRLQPGHRVRAVLVQVDQLIPGRLTLPAQQAIVHAGAQASLLCIAPRQKAQVVSGPVGLIGEDLPPLPSAAMHEHPQRIAVLLTVLRRLVQAQQQPLAVYFLIDDGSVAAVPGVAAR